MGRLLPQGILGTGRGTKRRLSPVVIDRPARSPPILRRHGARFSHSNPGDARGFFWALSEAMKFVPGIFWFFFPPIFLLVFSGKISLF